MPYAALLGDLQTNLVKSIEDESPTLSPFLAPELLETLPLLRCFSRQKSSVFVSYVRQGDGRTLTTDWEEDFFTVNGHALFYEEELFKRYENEFVQAEWGARNMTISAGEYFMQMNFDDGTWSFN